MPFSREINDVIFSIMTWDIVFLIISFDKKSKAPTFRKYGAILISVLSACLTIWILFNKERFHWNFDIATGEPVDHYDTYYECITHGAFACVCSMASIVVSYIRKRKEKRSDSV